MNTRSRTYRRETWTDPRQEIRSSPIHGKGIYARAPMRMGEVVEIIGGIMMADDGFTLFRDIMLRYNAVQIAEGVHLVELLNNVERREGSLNHSCDSNLWMADEVTIVSRFDIAAGQELTVDYALFSGLNLPLFGESCQCGSPDCRKQITGDDWKLTAVQNRYEGHFSPFINARIRRLRTRLIR